MNRDTMTGLLAAAVLVAAMVGVFFYERNVAIASGIGESTATDGNVRTLDGPMVQGTAAVGGSGTGNLLINQTGLTNVTFTLRWSATNGADTLRLTVAPSADTGLTAGAESDDEADGEITLTIAIPNTAADGVLGVGPWEITVTFVSAATGLPAEPPVAPPGTTDTEVAWSIETSLDALSA